jgi:hypothetical protein
MAALSGPGTVVDLGCKGTNISSTITFPGFSVALYLGPCLYSGPASGSTFVVNTYLSNGSSINGAGGVGSANQSNVNGGTVIQSNASNISDVIQVVSGTTSQTLQAYTLQNLRVDGNSSAANCFTIDAVRLSTFWNLTGDNCTAKAFNVTVANTGLDQGDQFNTWTHLRAYNATAGSAWQALVVNGNNLATSDVTLNVFTDLMFSCNGSSLPCIEEIQADGNVWTGVNVQSIGASATYCWQIDSPSGTPGNAGAKVGGKFNFILGFHAFCGPNSVSPTKPMNIQANSTGNQLYGYNQIEGQPFPTLGSNAELNAMAEYFFWMNSGVTLAWYNTSGSVEAGISHCGAGMFDFGNGVNCDGSGNVVAATVTPKFLVSLGIAGAGAGQANNSVCNFNTNSQTWQCSYNNDATITVVRSNNSGSAIIQSKKNVSGCTTSASVGGVCGTAITVTWPAAFMDSNYTAVCTPSGAPTNLPGAPYISAKATGTVTVNYFAITAAAASWATIDCSAEHD